MTTTTNATETTFTIRETTGLVVKKYAVEQTTEHGTITIGLHTTRAAAERAIARYTEAR